MIEAGNINLLDSTLLFTYMWMIYLSLPLICILMDIDNNSKFQLHHQHQPPNQHKYYSMSMTFRYHI
ncbi:hypothetical protein CsSME_00027431 [Camellia sinensis var. sinensis]